MYAFFRKNTVFDSIAYSDSTQQSPAEQKKNNDMSPKDHSLILRFVSSR